MTSQQIITIPHTQIEDLVSDPERWARARVNEERPFIRFGYEGCIREGIYRFHKNGRAAGRQHAVDCMASYGLTNQDRIADALERLDAYIRWASDAAVTVAHVRFNLRYEVQPGIRLGGRMPRVDILPDGYRGVLLIPPESGWETEVRMPVIQRALGQMFGRPTDEFSIGRQDTDGSQLIARRYTESQSMRPIIS